MDYKSGVRFGSMASEGKGTGMGCCRFAIEASAAQHVEINFSVDAYSQSVVADGGGCIGCCRQEGAWITFTAIPSNIFACALRPDIVYVLDGFGVHSNWRGWTSWFLLCCLDHIAWMCFSWAVPEFRDNSSDPLICRPGCPDMGLKGNRTLIGRLCVDSRTILIWIFSSYPDTWKFHHTYASPILSLHR